MNPYAPSESASARIAATRSTGSTWPSESSDPSRRSFEATPSANSAANARAASQPATRSARPKTRRASGRRERPARPPKRTGRQLLDVRHGAAYTESTSAAPGARSSCSTVSATAGAGFDSMIRAESTAPTSATAAST